MLAPVLRLPGKLLGGLFFAAVIAHGAFLARSGALWTNWPGIPLADLALVLAATLGGRIVLAWLPPGEPGGHGPRSLMLTLATSFAIGFPLAVRLEGRGALVAGGGLVLALLLRRLTLPGAMVPRHRTVVEPWKPLDWLVALLCVVRLTWFATHADGLLGLLWFTPFLIAFHALATARRLRTGRHVLLLVGAFAPNATRELAALVPGLSLGLGAAFLVPWLRRHDRRAGALAAIGFGSLFLGGLDPLAIACATVFVLASRPRQRSFALRWITSVAALALGLSFAGLPPFPFSAPEPLAYWALMDVWLWGLAWPMVWAGWTLGTLVFPWRSPWNPSLPEPPIREAVALGLLLVASAIALASPFTPWTPMQAMVLWLPPSALLAGLLAIPPEASR